MKHFLLVFMLAAGLCSCKQTENTGTSDDTEKASVIDGQCFYGEKFNTAEAITGKELKDKMTGISEMSTIVSGTVADVCKKEGCWLTLDMGDNTVMQVRMKEHSFLVPKDCEGRLAYIKGRAYMDTTEVEDLRHYAEDEGRTKEEIESITEPKVELVFEASGVALK